MCSGLFIAPGNAGTASLGENISIAVTDFSAIRDFCVQHGIDMVVVGPEEPLVKGIYDFFKKDPLLKDIIITGPSAAGARLEGSKAFAKSFMETYHIPTARYREFDADSFAEGVSYIQQHPLPVVLKADGLAAGKGVIISETTEEAVHEFTQMIREAKFGEAGRKVVVEEFLSGIELSVFVLTDGKNYVLLPEAKDYKKIGEGDKGLNTGGMGAISPVPFATDKFMQKVKEKIILPTIHGLQKEQIDYRGFIFFGLIRVGEEPFVIEYNCRMGDPETEAVLLRLKNDLVELFLALGSQSLDKHLIGIDPQAAATIVSVSGGYPLEYKKGLPIDFDRHPHNEPYYKGEAVIFHAGTLRKGDEIVTNGGRVLAVSSMAPRLEDAVMLSRRVLEQVYYEGMYYRSDIGYEFTT